MKNLIAGRKDYPQCIQFEPIQLCNALCYSCPYSWLQKDKEYRGARMSEENIFNLINEFGNILKNNNSEGEIAPWRYSDPTVCPDLELILKNANKNNIKVNITTNGVLLNGKRLEILERYSHILSPIVISIIGYDKESVKKYMNLNLDTLKNNLKIISDKNSPIFKKIRVGLKKTELSEKEDSEIKKLSNYLSNLGFNYSCSAAWESNRLGDDLGWDITKGVHRAGNNKEEKSFVSGCKKGKIVIRRMEVMYNGDVVLCCDDATGKKIFGNIFKEGILNVWNGKLKDEHKLIYAKEYSKEKDGLICNKCVRACYSD